MIQIEHINLVVNDIPESLRFYRAAFPHWRERRVVDGPRHLERPAHGLDEVALRVIHEGLTLNDNGEGEARDLAGHQPGLAHIGFVTHNLGALIERLQAAGFEVDHEGGRENFRRSVYFVDPSGLEVEFVEYTSDLPAERNLSR